MESRVAIKVVGKKTPNKDLIKVIYNNYYPSKCVLMACLAIQAPAVTPSTQKQPKATDKGGEGYGIAIRVVGDNTAKTRPRSCNNITLGNVF